MQADYHRHDISEGVWALLEPLLIGRKGTWGGNAKDNRRFINAVFWILRTGAPWRDLPPDYGNWNNVNRRFCRWRDKGEWERILEMLIQEPDYEWLMIDASHVKVHRTLPVLLVAIRIWNVQKGAQHKDTFGRGCEGYASQNPCYSRYHS